MRTSVKTVAKQVEHLVGVHVGAEVQFGIKANEAWDADFDTDFVEWKTRNIIYERTLIAVDIQVSEVSQAVQGQICEGI